MNVEMKSRVSLDQTSEPEMAFSLGKFVYEEDLSKWNRQNGQQDFPNPFGGFQPSRIAASTDDLSGLLSQGDNHLIDEQVMIKFKYQLPFEEIKDKYAYAQFLVKVSSHAPADHPSCGLSVEVQGQEAVTLQIDSFQRGAAQEVILKNPSMQEQEITLKIDGRGELFIDKVDLIVNPTPESESTSAADARSKSATLNALSGGEFDENQQSLQLQDIDTARQKSESVLDAEKDELLESKKKKHADLHQENNLRLLHEKGEVQCAKDYLEKVEFKIPLQKLYEVVASCHHTEGSDYCGLLLRIVDKNILNYTRDENGEEMPYLLQIWKQGGQIIYEKALKVPVCNWNITASKMLFQVTPEDPRIYLVSLRDEKQPKIYQFDLEESMIKNQKNTKFNATSGLFEVPPDFTEQSQGNEDSDDNNDSSRGIFAMLSLRSPRMSFENSLTMNSSSQVMPEHTYTEPISKKFKNDIIQRTPDKMIDYVHGCILLAYRHMFIYFDADQYLDDDSDGQPEKQVTLQKEDCHEVQLNKSNKIFCIQEIGPTESCLVVENIKTHHVRFMRIQHDNEKIDEKRLKLVGLGMEKFNKERKLSPMIKFRSSANFDEETNMWYHVAVLLRENGIVENYSDFTYTDCYENVEQQCVDIEAGGTNFFFKFVANQNEISSSTKKDDLQFIYGRARQDWKNRVGMSTVKMMTKSYIESWNQVMHRRFSQYVKLYTEMVNFSTFLIVAHRNLISMYDMRTENPDEGWVDTKKVSDDFVRSINIKKRQKKDRTSFFVTRQTTSLNLAESKNLKRRGDKRKKNSKKNRAKQLQTSILDKYEIVCLAGTHTFYMTRITTNEDNQPKLSDNIEPVKSDDRVIKHMNDGRHHMGITLLTDDGPEAVDFNFLSVTNSRVYTFPLSLKKAQSSSNVKIQALKMRKFFCLLSKEKDPESVEYLDYETSFMISKSNKKLFVKKFKASDGANDFCQVRKEYKGKKTIKILSVTKGKKVKHFPIYKARVRGSKVIQEIHLVKDEENIRTFVGAAMRDKVKKSKSNELGEENHQISKEPILEEYYLTYDEFDKNSNSYIQMSQNKIQIFNKDREVALSFRNCKIRNAQQVHQKFIYFSSDRVFDSITVRDELADDEEERQDHYKEGFYVLNVQALLRGQIERYKVTRTTGGLCNLIEYNMYSERLSYQEDYNTITVIPLPHLNTVNFIGMGNKHDYLVWREKRGFFTALDRKGALSTWSTLSGKLLYTIPQEPHTDASEDALMDYDVYRADKGDVTYTRHFYQLDHSSVNLLRCSLPVDGYSPDKIHAIGKGVHEDNLRKQIQKHREKNDDNDGCFAGEKFDPLKYLFADSSDITILNSEIQFDLYHFKVMELKSFEDTGEISECKLKFHFTHRLIKHDRDSGVVRGDKDVTDKGPRQTLISTSKNKDNAFEWDQSQDPMQRLYLSRDTKRLMEAVNNSFAIVYERFNINADGEIERPGDYYYEPEDHGQQIRWEAQYRITRWPSLLFQQTSVPYIFSPNFTYQLDFNYVDEQIVVLVTETQMVYMTFPADMMTTEYSDLSEYEAIDLIFSRMKWEPDEKERRIRICTSNNLDCIFEIQATDEPDEKVEDRYLKLISVCKVDNLHTDVYRQDSPHFYHQPFSLDTKDVIERLLRMNQNYKIQSAHAMNEGLVTDIKDYQELVLDQINKIDYTQPWGDLQADFSVEKSYTWLDWLIIDQVIKDPIFELKDVTDEQSLQLSQIILPDGKGILHMLADFRDSKASHINGIALDLFAMTKKEAQAFLENVDEPVKFEIPMLMDVEKQTALDICLEVNRKEEEKSAFVHLAEFFMSPKQYLKSDASTDKKSSRNIMLAGIIFDSIKDSGLLHSSQNTMDAVIKAVKLGLPAVKGYLESRVMKVEHDLMPFSHPRLKSAVRRSCPAIKGEYGYTTAPIFGKVSDITDNLFKSNRPPQPTKIECLDLPELHENFHRGREFIESLTECKDLDFFNLKSVQIIIDHHHCFWYQYNIASQVAPAIINVILFWGWNNLILPIRVRELEMRQLAEEDNDINKNDEVNEIIKQFNVGEFDMLVRVVSFIVTAYLMSNEFYIMTQNIYKFGTKDLAAFHFLQNLFFVGLTFNVLMSVYRADDEQVMKSSFWSFQAWVSLSVWVRIMFQYLKEVRELSWTIGLIVNSVVSTGQFMIVFILSINAFSDSFNSISQSYKLRLFHDDEVKTKLEDIDLTFRTNFEDWVNWWQITFKASLGDFPEEWGDLNYFHYHDWLIFFFAVFFLVILMLNLLIAIISEAQVIYTENKDQTTYRERALQVRTRFYSFLYPALVDAKKSTITPEFMYIVQQASAQRTLDEAEEKSLEEQVGDLDAKINELTEMAHEAALKGKEEDKPSWWPPKPSSAGPEKLGGESLLSVNRPASKQRPGSKRQSKQPRDEELYRSIDSLGYQSSSHESDFTDDDRPVNASPKQRRASILVKKNTKR